MPSEPTAPLPTNIGSSSNAVTVRRSSTTVQPIAMWPIGACKSCRSASTSAITTVLATEMDTPSTMPDVHDQPSNRSSPARAIVEMKL
jgi:hypothetical protein